jgi:hypothetical protein
MHWTVGHIGCTDAGVNVHEVHLKKTAVRVCALLMSMNLVVACGPMEGGPEQSTLPDEIGGAEQGVISDTCTSFQYKTIALPGKTDIQFIVDLCTIFDSATDRMRGWMRLNWVPTSFLLAWELNDDDNRFDGVNMRVRLERHTSTGSVTVYSKACIDIEKQINTETKGTAYCITDWFPSGSSYWQTDGRIDYAVNNDGLGTFYWQLGGTAFTRTGTSTRT